MLIRDEDDRLPTAAMIRAARGLVGLEATQLAQAVGVSRKTLHEIERDVVQPMHERRIETLRRIKSFFADRYGVVFLFDEDDVGEGVRLSRSSTPSRN